MYISSYQIVLWVLSIAECFYTVVYSVFRFMEVLLFLSIKDGSIIFIVRKCLIKTSRNNLAIKFQADITLL